MGEQFKGASSGEMGEPAGFAEAPQTFLAPDGGELGPERVETVLTIARRAGLLEQKTARISGRVSPELVKLAKRRSGMMSDTDVIEFALANVALDDPFLEVFEQVRGSVDPDIELGF